MSRVFELLNDFVNYSYYLEAFLNLFNNWSRNTNKQTNTIIPYAQTYILTLYLLVSFSWLSYVKSMHVNFSRNKILLALSILYPCLSFLILMAVFCLALRKNHTKNFAQYLKKKFLINYAYLFITFLKIPLNKTLVIKQS